MALLPWIIGSIIVVSASHGNAASVQEQPKATNPAAHHAAVHNHVKQGAPMMMCRDMNQKCQDMMNNNLENKHGHLEMNHGIHKHDDRQQKETAQVPQSTAELVNEEQCH